MNMKRLALAVVLVLSLIAAFPGVSPEAGKSPAIAVYFSPDGGCTDAIIKEIGAARSSILVQAYSFTSAPIAKALVDASKRGVKVQAILDKSNRTGKYSAGDFLVNASIPTLIDARHAIAHNKIMVIDGETVITGSFNFTKSAEEKNAENLLIIRDKELAAKYAENVSVLGTPSFQGISEMA